MGEKLSKVVEGWTGPGRSDGVIEPLALKDDGLYSDINKKGLYEWWYFDAHLDSGHTIVVFFHASNPNPGRTGKIGIEFILISPEGQRKQEFFVYDKSEFAAAHDKPEVRIGRNSIKVVQQEGKLPVYEIFVEEQDLGCHLKYTAEVNGWKPGSGISQFGDLGFMGWVVPFARASVEGTISDGGKTTQVTGIGYHDHNWLNFQFQKIIDFWMWGRIYSKNYTAAYAYIQCNEKVDHHAVKVLMLAEGQEVILSTGEFDFIKEDYEYNSSAKHHYPRKIIIRAPEELEAALQVKEVLEAQDMLDNFNPLLRFAAKNILRIKPGYFRLVSDFELEVIRGGEPLKEVGTTMHEIVMFKPLE
ncbi:MAG: lipocalin-like domain-containing protein [Anaerolineales bacterium]